MTPQMTGREAIDFAEQHGLPLRSYADPTSPARDDLTLEEAREIAAQDPQLVYLPPQVEIEIVISPTTVAALGTHDEPTCEAQLVRATGCDFSAPIAYERLERDGIAVFPREPHPLLAPIEAAYAAALEKWTGVEQSDCSTCRKAAAGAETAALAALEAVRKGEWGVASDLADQAARLDASTWGPFTAAVRAAEGGRRGGVRRPAARRRAGGGGVMASGDDEPIAYDTSASMYDLSVLCRDCGADEDGSPLYEGEKWGGPVPECSGCGAEIVGLVEVDP